MLNLDRKRERERERFSKYANKYKKIWEKIKPFDLANSLANTPRPVDTSTRKSGHAALNKDDPQGRPARNSPSGCRYISRVVERPSGNTTQGSRVWKSLPYMAIRRRVARGNDDDDDETSK